MYHNAMAYHVLPAKRLLNNPMAKERTMLSKQDGVGALVFAVGGFSASDGFWRIIEQFDIRTNEWTTITPLKQARKGCAVVLFKDTLRIFGGTGGTGTRQYENYDLSTDMVIATNMVPASCSFPAAVILNGSINGYNFEVTTMSADKQYPGATVINGQIFVCGITGGWNLETPMLEPCYACSCIGLDGFLYVIGGLDSKFILPHANDITQKLEHGAPLLLSTPLVIQQGWPSGSGRCMRLEGTRLATKC